MWGICFVEDSLIALGLLGMILADFVECIGSSAWSLLFSCSPFRHVFGLMHNILVNSLDVVLLVFLACLVMAMA
mgnify:CR=1 FL=1